MNPQPVTTVRLTPAAVHTITTELRTADHTTETGGILLGYHSADVATIHHAGTPGPAAVRTPTYFLRDRAHAQMLADQAFAADSSVWIGEWHTHPTGRAAPSARDATTYQQLLSDPELGFTSVVALILAKRDGQWTGAAWAAHDGGIAPAALELLKPHPENEATGRLH
ncbi:Mov34/MPN/PAD-1 family protein [Streptomyces sp. NPDC046979]|uniref:Mov34/MPN/PAD-1 family protein n=1 Tax=Streptomyces sp. NPDC046979 TaxID=3154604 RepID=UPI0033E6AAD6